jgi:c-di-GMP-binding flagellar brake protein YcgR
MIRLQRRNFYRVNSEYDMIVSIRLFHSSGKSWQGELLDLSVGGCGIIIDDSLPIKDLSRNPIKCEITLPNMEPFIIQTMIRTVQHVEHYKNHIRLGCETIDISPVDAKTYTYF